MRETAYKKLFEGSVIPAIPLVLNESRKFDEAGQRTLVRYYLNAGVDGIAAAVHTTQFEIRYKGIDLFEPVLKIVAEEVDAFEAKTGKTVIKVAGACGEASQAVEEAKTAKALGYDAVLLSPGGLAHLDEAALLARTEAVAAEMPVIGFYLQNSVGGRYLSFDYWKSLAEIENVVAVKAASFNRYQTVDLVRGVAFSARYDKVALYTGNDDNIVIDLLTPYKFNVNGEIREKRFIGGLLGHWSVWTKAVVDMFAKIKAVRYNETIPAELLTLAAEVTDANAAFFDVINQFSGCIAGIHEVLRHQDLMKGIWCLNPEETLSVGQLEEIKRVYDAYPHLNDDAFINENIDSWR